MFVVAIVAVLVAAGALGYIALERRRFMLHRRVVVNLKSDKAVDGVLFVRRGGVLVLKQARLFEGPGRDPVTVDGDVVIERHNVEFVQMLATPEV